MKIIQKNIIEIYVDEHGKCPFIDWLESLKDKIARHRIKERLDRVSLGIWVITNHWIKVFLSYDLILVVVLEFTLVSTVIK